MKDNSPDASCPCGSGRPARECCRFPLDQPADLDIPAEVRQALARQEFEDLAHLQRFLDDFMVRYNRQPREEFHGLSPEQVHRLTYFPFESPELVQITEMAPAPDRVPMLRIFQVLVEALGDQGLKHTAKGNLPRKVCREMALARLGEAEYREATRFGGINTELDYDEGHATRVLAELAGLVRKYRGRFVLTRKCRGLLERGGAAAAWPLLFDTYVRKFNWAYRDGYPDLPFIQQAWAFSLYLLVRYGTAWRLDEFYSGHFLRAFPALLKEVRDEPYRSAEDTVRQCYAIRTLARFACFLGLAESERVETGGILGARHRVRALPLLYELIRFNVTAPLHEPPATVM